MAYKQMSFLPLLIFLCFIPPHLSYIRGVRRQQTCLRSLCLQPQSAHNSERRV